MEINKFCEKYPEIIVKNVFTNKSIFIIFDSKVLLSYKGDYFSYKIIPNWTAINKNIVITMKYKKFENKKSNYLLKSEKGTLTEEGEKTIYDYIQKKT